MELINLFTPLVRLGPGSLLVAECGHRAIFCVCVSLVQLPCHLCVSYALLSHVCLVFSFHICLPCPLVSGVYCP